MNRFLAALLISLLRNALSLSNFKYGIIARLELNMEDKITIIEGPPPTFEAISDGWALGLNEGPSLADIMITRLRTYNGPSLVERCFRAWHNRQTINLEYRTSDGLQALAPIVAARFVEMEEGQLLLLWIRMVDDKVELEFGYEDDADDESDDDFGYPDLPE
jgi:hypothetical protein